MSIPVQAWTERIAPICPTCHRRTGFLVNGRIRYSATGAASGGRRLEVLARCVTSSCGGEFWTRNRRAVRYALEIRRDAAKAEEVLKCQQQIRRG